MGWVRLGAGGGKGVSCVRQGRAEGSGSSANIPVVCVCGVVCVCVWMDGRRVNLPVARKQAECPAVVDLGTCHEPAPPTNSGYRQGISSAVRAQWGVCAWDGRGEMGARGDSCDSYKVVSFKAVAIRLR